ncbi:MAG TPA: acyl-CoA dehydrogenase family protein, partial [Vicingus sp.]|nr:acyl-CoA dehydrogenase family protein [Vicingus sp.]
MDFKYTENQLMIADMIRDFGDKNIRPKMMEWDNNQTFPIEVFK